jgi:uncharacterized membrane protein
VLILLLGILSYFGFVQYYVLVLGIVVSVILVVKGFGVDKTVRGFYKWAKEYSPPPLRVQISSYSAGAGVLLVVLGVYLGVAKAAAAVEVTPQPDITGYLSLLPRLTGFFIGDAITLTVIGVCVALLGRAIRWYLEHDVRLLRNGALIVTVAWSRQIFMSASDLLLGTAGPERVVLAIIIGILIGVASVLIVFIFHRRAKRFFREADEQVEEFGEE